MERARLARRRRRIRVATVGATVLVLAAGAATGAYFRYYRTTPVPARPGEAGHYAPVTLNADNSVTMARSGVAKPVLDVFEDFQCAECRAFELGNGRVIQQLAERGKIRVVYHPFTVFGSQMQQASSVRAWAAAKCAPANRWVSYHNELYASQPAGTAGSGFTTTLLVQLGRKAGITSPSFASCVRSQRYAAQNDPLSNQILNSGMNSPPVLMLNGRILTVSPLSPRLRQHILSASERGPGTSSS